MSISQMLPEALAQKYREHLKPFEGHAQELLDLLVMHPHIASILDSRIVDHNLDVANPPNGYYVRWENGLQVCLFRRTSVLASMGDGWEFPASFRAGYWVYVDGFDYSSSPSQWRKILLRPYGDDPELTTKVAYYPLVAFEQRAETDGPIVLIAVGRWK